MLILALAGIAAALFMMFMLQRKSGDQVVSGVSEGSEPEGKSKKQAKTQGIHTAQGFLGFDGIKDGVILLPGGRYAAVMEVGAVNYALLTQSEQQALMGQYQQFLNGLSFPIQIYVQTRHADFYDTLTQYGQALATAPIEVKRYGQAVMEELTQWASGGVMITKNYIIVTTDDMTPRPGDPFQVAASELANRLAVLDSGLSRMGLARHRLNNQDLTEFLYITFNRERAVWARPDDPSRYGFYDLVVTGMKEEQANGTFPQSREASA
jgi:hypothetical protein